MILNEDAGEKGTAKFNLDLDEPLRTLGIAARRVTAFLRFGYALSDLDTVENFDAEIGVRLRFWPDPLDRAAVQAAWDEYCIWLAGSCLTDLEQHFSYFLDQTWVQVDLIDQGPKVRSDYLVDESFSKDTNTHRKTLKLVNRMGFELPIDHLETLSKARNCLRHGLGIVRVRDCNADGFLNVQWTALHFFLEVNGSEIPLSDAIEQQFVAPDGGATICMRVENREISFPVGTQVKFDRVHLVEIAHYYHNLSTEIRSFLFSFAGSKGVLVHKES